VVRRASYLAGCKSYLTYLNLLAANTVIQTLTSDIIHNLRNEPQPLNMADRTCQFNLSNRILSKAVLSIMATLPVNQVTLAPALINLVLMASHLNNLCPDHMASQLNLWEGLYRVNH